MAAAPMAPGRLETALQASALLAIPRSATARSATALLAVPRQQFLFDGRRSVPRRVVGRRSFRASKSLQKAVACALIDPLGRHVRHVAISLLLPATPLTLPLHTR